MRKRSKYAIKTLVSESSGSISRGVSPPRALGIWLLWCCIVGAIFARAAIADSLGTAASEDRWTNLGKGVLRDARTKLEWTQEDNGDDIDWNDAKSRCDGRHSGWRLPSLNNLKSIYDEHERGVQCGQAICKVSLHFYLTGSWFWSATQVGKDSTDGIELAWGVLMVNGAQTQAVRDASYGSRVLCVRGP